MNFTLLNNLVGKSKLGKSRIAEEANISRTTLDNALNGSDIKVSTIESLSRVLGVSPSIFFSQSEEKEIIDYEKEIERLKTLLNNQNQSTKVIVELDVTSDEFIKMGLKEKVIQILNR